ncbi:hypothetical protein L226DRAFT_617358 [Lentinus tigrinus ALCF2SS1-7]|uniref:Fungal-type protein kinase domain-containing protein n=1 Tax=Lentinus tigrinus ALCF2SS1-6 TaxID=1328759 RepID=A0A5C2RR84_9APHY|nr:hypothetical protein L227DRAFT_658026 [Lentinus tigrinus ALCF2SS1-6]RPD68716.1 hypothetical protein L226DRAFT_617358 [Lentinus tigrinus ALCF2SS1-7]
MADGADCSVWMPFGQFMKKYLYCDVEDNFPEENLEAASGKVREAFLKALEPPKDAPVVLPGEKNSVPLEKRWSQAWYTVSQDTTLPIKLCPGFILHLSEDTPASGTAKVRVDGSLISEDDRERIKPKEPNWDIQRLPIEFKRGGVEHDPFDDDPRRKHEATSDERRSVYGQLMTYASRVMVNQHRKHVFLLLVNGPEFRVMLFDHGGVMTSEAIDYISTVEGTAALLTFLHAFNKLDPAEQGIDPTVVALSSESCGYKRMDELKEAYDDDLDHRARFVDDPAMISSSILNSRDPEVVVDVQDTHLHRDPTHECKGLQCHADCAVLPVFTYVRDAFRRSIPPGQARLAVKVGQCHYLIGRYANDPPTSLVGRGTKGYVALEWETQRFVFLKDTWRSYYNDIEREGDILRKLNSQGVKNVPTVIAHGDVEEQETETSNYSPVTGEKKVENRAPFLEVVKANAAAKRLQSTVVGRMKPNPKDAAGSEDRRGQKRTADDRITEENFQQGQGLRHLTHYRLVVKEICLSLACFTDSEQLVGIIMDCVLAHEMAYKKCHLIHRDVSFGNVLIIPRLGKSENGQYCVAWKGLLSDWELAKDYRITKALQPERTGTWYFMSWYILTYTDQPVTIPDELESFVHVLIYAAVRLVDHIYPDIRGFIEYYFDGYVVTEDSSYGCPSGKSYCIVQGQLTNSASPNDLLFRAKNLALENHPLNKLVCELLALIRTRYIVLAHQRRLASKVEMHRPVSPSPSRPVGQKPRIRDTLSDVESDSDEEDDEEEEETESYSGGKSDKARAKQTTGEALMNTDPSRATRAAAKSLEKHSTLRKLLQKYLDDCTWPNNDTVRDRLKKYTPRPRESISDVDSESSRKKARVDTGKAPAPAAVASGSKDHVQKASKSRRRVTRQKTSSESLGGQDADKGTGTSNERAASRSGGASQRVTRSASRNGNGNGDPRPDRPQAGPPKASTRTRSDSIQPGEAGGSQGRKRVTRAASGVAGCPTGGTTGGSTTTGQPYTQKKYGKRRNTRGKK